MAKTLDPELAGVSWPYNDTDDGSFDPAELIVFADVAQDLINEARKSALPSIDHLAQIIRTVDGSNELGAGALAEAIVNALSEA